MNPNTLLPFVSLVSLFVYFLVADTFTSSLGKYLWGILGIILVSSDLFFRLIQSSSGQTDNQKNTRFLVSGLGILSYLFYQLRVYLDFPPTADRKSVV